MYVVIVMILTNCIYNGEQNGICCSHIVWLVNIFKAFSILFCMKIYIWRLQILIDFLTSSITFYFDLLKPSGMHPSHLNINSILKLGSISQPIHDSIFNFAINYSQCKNTYSEIVKLKCLWTGWYRFLNHTASLHIQD